ncbi:MAG: hypothetical protein D6741_13535, partial [Planctomycetota bacterium]
AYSACPVCGPSRAALMTGKYIYQIKTWYNGFAWPEDEADLAKKVTAAGYYTALFGKMDCPGVYGKLGFSEEWDCSRRPLYTPEEARKVLLRIRRAKGHLAVKTFKVTNYRGPRFEVGARGPFGNYALDYPTTQRALRFLEQRKADGKPWMLYVGYNMPHWPLTLPQQYYDLYADADIPMPHDAKFPNKGMHPALQYFQKWDGLDALPAPGKLENALRAYYGVVSCVDGMLGDLIAQLKKTGMYENTYIIFTSDHGDNLGEHGVIGNKHTPLNGSVCVPLVIAGPGVRRGAVVDTPVSLIDLYPTILDMAGLPFHDSERPSKNLLPILQGKEAPADRTVFAEWHGTGFPGAWYMLANKQYKYIYYEGYRPSLFDESADPEEVHDLALDPAHAETVKQFETMLNAMLDPVEVAKQARRDEGLITPDGRDLLLEQVRNGNATRMRKVDQQ